MIDLQPFCLQIQHLLNQAAAHCELFHYLLHELQNILAPGYGRVVAVIAVVCTVAVKLVPARPRLPGLTTPMPDVFNVFTGIGFYVQPSCQPRSGPEKAIFSQSSLG